MNNSTISFTIHDNDAFLGLKSFTEHHFIAKSMFDLRLIVCNDVKLQKNRLFNTRQTKQSEQNSEKGWRK